MGRKETALLITIAVNLGLIGLKFVLAGASGSLSLRASAWHSFSDVFVSLLVLAGLLVVRLRLRQTAARRAAVEAARGDNAIPVSQIEHVVSLLVAAFIFYIGFDIFSEALAGEEPELHHVFWVTLASALTIALSYFMGRYKTYVGRATGSPALVADGYHSLMDMYSSIVVVAGLLGYAIGFRSLDRVAAVIVVLFIALAGYEVARDALAGLLGGGRSLPSQQGEPAGPHRAHEPLRLLRTGAPALGAVLAVMYVLSGVYVVQPGEAAVVRRFGRIVAAGVGPGPHYRLPWPVDSLTILPVGAVQRADAPRSLMLTGDENLVDVAATVHYRIRDAAAYVLAASRPADLVSVGAESALRQAVGLRPIDGLLTGDKASIQEETRRQLQAALDARATGLEVLAVQISEATPPKDVAAAFLDVASAREDRATYINEALAYRNEILPKARGDAARQLREAEGYRVEKIAAAGGEAARFASRLAEYRNAPAVTRTRLYLEAVERVLPRVQKFLLSPDTAGTDMELWFSRGGASPVTLPEPSAGASRPASAPAPAPAPAPPAPPAPIPTAARPAATQAASAAQASATPVRR